MELNTALLIGIIVGLVVVIALLLGRRGSGTEAVRAELRAGRDESREGARDLRQDLSGGLKATHDTIATTMRDMGAYQKSQLDGVATQLRELTDSSQKRLEGMRATIDTRLEQIQQNNDRRLEAMRNTVDEKLQSTLERRLSESFKLVSERLEAVQRGLGEMQSLATGVDDLRRVLSNVKARGTWAEYQLGAILEQTLAPNQYARNVKMRVETNEVVEFAIRLPGPDGDPNTPVWLPIDSKFPQEDYVRLREAAEKVDAPGVQKAADALARTARHQARTIRDKYVNPPSTTDFAIMFLATEGLYAEILRQPGLVEELHNEHRVVIAGPATITAILSSLRLGFRTLAIEERASEVWRVLAAVKTEFGKFGEVLDRVKRHLDKASRTIDETNVRTRAMERKLRDVEQMPQGSASELLDLPPLPREGAARGEDDFDHDTPRQSPGGEGADEEAPGRPASSGSREGDGDSRGLFDRS